MLKEIMKKLALLLIATFAISVRGQIDHLYGLKVGSIVTQSNIDSPLLLSAEKNEPSYFKHLHQMSPKVQQFCRDVEKNKGPVRYIVKCADLDNEYEALSELRAKIDAQEKYLESLKDLTDLKENK